MTEERKPPSKAAIGGTLGLAAAVALATPLIQKWEGKRNDPYRDIVGVLTVCYGETANVQMRRYSDAECSAMLGKSIEKHAKPVLACTPALGTRPYELAAAISLAYNVGTSAYCKSTADRRFDAKNWRGGCDAILMWNKAGGRYVQGLANRRREERKLCLKGTANG